MSIIVSRVDPDDSAALVAFNELLRRGYAAGREGVWWRSAAATVAQFTKPRANRTDVALVASLDGAPVGAAEALWVRGEPAEVEIAVLPAYRRRGYGTGIFAQVRAALPDAQLAVAESYSDAGTAFAEAMGLTIGNREARLLLDWPLPAGAAAALRRPVPGLELRSWITRCPDDLVAAVAALHQQMEQDVPVGDLTRVETPLDVPAYRVNEERMAAAGYRVLTVAALLDGRAVGYTELFVDPKQPELALQDDTLVERAVRGRGIGRALKLANLERLAAEPTADRLRYVQSWTALTNEPMLALNRAVGFRVADVMTALEGPLHGPAGR